MKFLGIEFSGKLMKFQTHCFQCWNVFSVLFKQAKTFNEAEVLTCILVGRRILHLSVVNTSIVFVCFFINNY